MDVRRSIIFVGLAIVSYMLILAWNDDYGQVPVQPTASSVYPTNSIEPSTELVHKEDSSEFSTPEEVTSDSSSMATSNDASSVITPLQKSITIKTDVLDLVIDLKGGNVVFAAMPEYKITLGSEQALPLLESNSARHYVVESGLFGKNGFDSSKNGPMPSYTTTSNQYELAENQDELVVDLVFKDETGVSVIKRYQFARNDYLIKVSYIIDNQSQSSWEGNLSGKIVRDNTGDPSQQSSMGMQSFLGMALSSAEKPYEKYNFEDMTDEPINEQIQGGWISFIQHYFLSAWIPNAEITHTYQSKVRNNLFLMGFISPATVVETGSSGEVSASLYLGPKIIEKLKAVAPDLDLTVDFGMLFWIANPLFWLLNFFFGFVQNWGIAIILVTLVVKALFFKLSAASYRSMANMRRVAPKLKILKEQHGDDRQKMSAAMMELYKKEKINPLGGCLPILVQMPVFIALYWVLLESVQLRHAPFMFWITDMSVKDPLFILPILMGISMFIQMQLNPAPPDPMQAKIMKIMPIMMTLFFLWFPAGLVLYWLVNNILSISQQWIITRQIEKANP